MHSKPTKAEHHPDRVPVDKPRGSSDGKPLVMLSPDPVQDVRDHNWIVAWQHCHVVAGEVPVRPELCVVRLLAGRYGMVWYGIWYGMAWHVTG